jgi:hypothetical protein
MEPRHRVSMKASAARTPRPPIAEPIDVCPPVSSTPAAGRAPSLSSQLRLWWTKPGGKRRSTPGSGYRARVDSCVGGSALGTHSLVFQLERSRGSAPIAQRRPVRVQLATALPEAVPSALPVRKELRAECAPDAAIGLGALVGLTRRCRLLSRLAVVRACSRLSFRAEQRERGGGGRPHRAKTSGVRDVFAGQRSRSVANSARRHPSAAPAASFIVPLSSPRAPTGCFRRDR